MCAMKERQHNTTPKQAAAHTLKLSHSVWGELKKATFSQIVKSKHSIETEDSLPYLTITYHTTKVYWKMAVCVLSVCNLRQKIDIKGSFISVTNQIDAQYFCFTISLFHASTCFEYMCSSSGGQNCITQPLVSSHL